MKTNGAKIVYFNGNRYCRDEKSGYYKQSGVVKNGKKTTSFLHRDIWESVNGALPKSFSIHHVDKDKNNNDIENLVAMPRSKHSKLHSGMLTLEEQEKRRLNMLMNAHPAAKEWHSSEEGRKWHREHYKTTREKLYEKHEKVCLFCHSSFIGIAHQSFCSNKCKSAYRRKMGKDLVEVKCGVCGKSFMTNRFKKSSTCSLHCAMVRRWKNRKSAT